MEHKLYKSDRVKGRFAFDEPGGRTMSDYHPIVLKLGKFDIPGSIRTDHDTSWFVAEGGTFTDDRIELREGMTVRESGPAAFTGLQAASRKGISIMSMSEDEIKDLLSLMGAKVERKKDGYISISLTGTKEKEAPTLKDAFTFWVFEMVMARPGVPRPRKHQYALKRNYQFTNKVWRHHDDERKISAWVTNVTGSNPLYGVVRYFEGDRAAWIESPEDFGQGKEAAIQWCELAMHQLAREMQDKNG